MKKGKTEYMQSSLCVMTKPMKVPCTQAVQPGPLADGMFYSESGQRKCPLHRKQNVALPAGCTEVPE